MGRKRLDDGRRVSISAKISERHAEAIDAERGSQTRSSWLAALIASHFGSGPDRAPEKHGGQMAPPNAPAVPRSSKIPEPPPAEPCRHPKARVTKGWCSLCKTNIS